MPIINTVIAGGGGNNNNIYLEVDSNGKLIMGNGPVNLSGIKDLGDNVLYRCRYGSNYTGEFFINAEELTQITGNYALLNCGIGSKISSFSLPNLETISGARVFSSATYDYGFATSNSPNYSLTFVSLPRLTIVTNGGLYYAFAYCKVLDSIYLPRITSQSYSARLTYPDLGQFIAYSSVRVLDIRNLQTVGNYGVLDSIGCYADALITVNLNSLEHIGTEGARAAFYISSASSVLSEIKFPMLTTFGTNPFYTNAFTGRKGLTIHFRKDAQGTVEALANYATLWGAGTGSSVVFDLAGTLTGADSNAYTRSEINSVYASETAGAAKTATGWKYNDTVYYTSGGTEPTVGDTIYSDAACTTAVTTISAIA